MVLVLLCGVHHQLFSQAWMSGYEFRRKIVFDKAKIEGDVVNGSNGRTDFDVTDFPVLVEIQDEVFKYRAATACEGIVYDFQGRNVAFALLTAPAVKLSFQIESYDPVLGKYRCWIRIPVLASAKTATAATAVYFYYGGTTLHDNYSTAALHTWNDEYTGIWHMNGDNPDGGSGNVKTGLAAENLTGHGFTAGDQIRGKVGGALELDGQTKYLHTAGNNNYSFTISAWLKWEGGTSPQIIAANDSIDQGRKGWQLRVHPDGKLELMTYRSASLSYVHRSAYTLLPGQWMHIVCSFAASETGYNTGFYLNGISAGGSGGSGLRLTPGEGYISIGRNKDGTQYFKGAIDELRLYNVAKPAYWLKNEYQNQYDPASFYSIGAEEANSSWAVFTGAANASWSSAANWLNALKPISGGKVRILAGKTARMTGSDVTLGQLVLENGAELSVGANLQLVCNVSLGAAAVLNMDADKKLTLAGNGLNISGTGTVNAGIVEVNAASAGSMVELNATLKVSHALSLVKGKLAANEKLWLLASKETTAALWLVSNPGNTGLSGLVNVQNFVDGSFPEPSSGRGWRLLSSPVFQSDGQANYQYGFLDIKNAVFVTGKGGVANGFDASPNNGATIYIHDQSLPGTLKEKYVPVPDLNSMVSIGKGFYLFSRGSRLLENAYQNQVQTSPFVNPGPYLITYKGKLHVGDLTVEVHNRNLGGEGDGYSLLGNPYAAPIQWGSLIKENVGPFIWLYDPLNQSYRVSDDPQTVIPAGTGFFIKVLDGFDSGRVKFTEESKVKITVAIQ